MTVVLHHNYQIHPPPLTQHHPRHKGAPINYMSITFPIQYPGFPLIAITIGMGGSSRAAPSIHNIMNPTPTTIIPSRRTLFTVKRPTTIPVRSSRPFDADESVTCPGRRQLILCVCSFAPSSDRIKCKLRCPQLLPSQVHHIFHQI